jgi:hypothetical protein
MSVVHSGPLSGVAALVTASASDCALQALGLERRTKPAMTLQQIISAEPGPVFGHYGLTETKTVRPSRATRMGTLVGDGGTHDRARGHP